MDNPEQDSATGPDPDTSSIGAGIALAFALNLTAGGGTLLVLLFFVSRGLQNTNMSLLGTILVGFVLLIGISQLLYIVPLIVRAFRRGDANRAKGHLIGASATLLLNGVCWNTVASGGLIGQLQQLLGRR
jgi:hypothetical protein